MRESFFARAFGVGPTAVTDDETALVDDETAAVSSSAVRYPRHPSLLSPHENARPHSVAANVWCFPAATATTRSWAHIPTEFGPIG